jgi:hypothetical protein
MSINTSTVAILQTLRVLNQASADLAAIITGAVQTEQLQDLFAAAGSSYGDSPKEKPAAENTGTSAPVETAPVATAPAADASTDPVVHETTASAATDTQTPLDIVLGLLKDERYTLRSAKSLAEKSGLSVDEVEELLNDNDIEYVTKRKRGSGDLLIGLEERN